MAYDRPMQQCSNLTTDLTTRSWFRRGGLSFIRAASADGAGRMISRRASSSRISFRTLTDVVLLSVTDDKEFRAFRSGADLCQYLARWEIIARLKAIERGEQTVGAALLEHARQIDADLLVMGGFGHAKEREFIVGSATRDIFESYSRYPCSAFPLKVIVYLGLASPKN